MPIFGSRNAFKTRRTRQIFMYSSGLCDGMNDFPKWAERIRLFCVSTSNSQPAASTHSATDSGSLFFIKHKYSSDWWLFSYFHIDENKQWEIDFWSIHNSANSPHISCAPRITNWMVFGYLWRIYYSRSSALFGSFHDNYSSKCEHNPFRVSRILPDHNCTCSSRRQLKSQEVWTDTKWLRPVNRNNFPNPKS